MRRTTLALMPLVALAALQGCGGAGAGAAGKDLTLTSEDDKTLYALGLSMGGNLTAFKFSAVEIRTVNAGLSDAASGAEPRVDMQVYGPKIRDLVQARAARAAETEKESSKEFLEDSAGAPGAAKLPSGLVYLDLTKGGGASPKATDKVRVHYRGTLTDGTEFDSSHKRGEPAEFPLGSVIPCWTEGVQKMAVGGKARLICPSSIAYGDSGRPPVIPPGATLVFEIELLEILK